MLYDVVLGCETFTKNVLVKVSMPLWHEVEKLPNGKSHVLGSKPFCKDMRSLNLTVKHCNDNGVYSAA